MYGMEPIKGRKRTPDHIRAERYVNRDTKNGCWEWIGYITPSGYGQFYYNEKRNNFAHRFMYEQHVGPIPEGKVIDHLCRNRKCCNPEHLEPVTQAENLVRGVGFGGTNSRKERCPRGHEYTEENTYYRPDRFGRDCATCRQRRTDVANAKTKAKRAARAALRNLGEAA